MDVTRNAASVPATPAIKVAVVRYTSGDGITPNAHEVGNVMEINNNTTAKFYYGGFDPNNGDTLTTQSSLLVPNVYYESSKVMRQVQGRLLRGNLILLSQKTPRF